MNRWTQRALLTLVRERLGTWPHEVPSDGWTDKQLMDLLEPVDRRVETLLQRIRDLGELFVGMANGPFLLVLRASDPSKFIQYANERPTHQVRFAFEQTQAGEIQGTISPLDEPEAYRLSFGLPSVLADHILFDENRGVRLAPEIKRRFLSEITVYRRHGERDVLYRLTYDPEVGRQARQITRRR
jgi:hypothetical protein